MDAWHPHVLEVWNINDQLGIAIDGEEQLTMTVTVEKSPSEVWLSPAFGVFGGSAKVNGIALDRDLYYTDAGHEEAMTWTVPRGEVFVLGDNSAESRDSRQFGTVQIDDLVGRPFAVYYPFERARLLD
jgi:hypothetical protein